LADEPGRSRIGGRISSKERNDEFDGEDGDEKNGNANDDGGVVRGIVEHGADDGAG
jgi:hypothetical protein